MSRVIGYTPGVWDMLHIGHIEFLRKAKTLCDTLIVGVQSDELAYEQKGVRPIISTKDRVATLEALDCVSVAVPYTDYDYAGHVSSVNADILILSEDYRDVKRFDTVRNLMKHNGKNVFYLPYRKGISTTGIRNILSTQDNFWASTWERVAQSIDNDYEVGGHHRLEITQKIAQYIVESLSIKPQDIVLDYGCGTGVVLKELSCRKIGIDISPSMLARARKNCPDGLFLLSDKIPFEGKIDAVFSWGTLHYLPNYDLVSDVVMSMKRLSKRILLMELPDIVLRKERISKRRLFGKKLDPEPLYFEREFFERLGFKVLTDEPRLTDNSQTSFSVKYDD